ncbi:MAG: hypothetical protein E5W82_28915 [Mesorhizobium sp.]|nr:MAG: hypothetical protein E5W82_28915 [Mesorhizobium sp.]
MRIRPDAQLITTAALIVAPFAIVGGLVYRLLQWPGWFYRLFGFGVISSIWAPSAKLAPCILYPVQLQRLLSTQASFHAIVDPHCRWRKQGVDGKHPSGAALLASWHPAWRAARRAALLC